MKNSKKRYILVGVIFSMITLVTIFTFRQEAQDRKQVPRTPVVDYEQRNNILLVPNRNPSQNDREKRSKKNRKHNLSVNMIQETPPGIFRVSRSGHWIFDVPSLPIKESDEIVLGVVKTGTAFLSEDKTGIYSEFLVRVERVLKPSTVVSEGSEIVVERVGGTIRFPSGKLQRIRIFKGQEMPQNNGKYVFFLKKTEDDNLKILTGYELRETGIKALDRLDPYQRQDNEDVNSFIDKVLGVINNPNLQENVRRN